MVRIYEEVDRSQVVRGKIRGGLGGESGENLGVLLFQLYPASTEPHVINPPIATPKD